MVLCFYRPPAVLSAATATGPWSALVLGESPKLACGDER